MFHKWIIWRGPCYQRQQSISTPLLVLMTGGMVYSYPAPVPLFLRIIGCSGLRPKIVTACLLPAASFNSEGKPRLHTRVCSTFRRSPRDVGEGQTPPGPCSCSLCLCAVFLRAYPSIALQKLDQLIMSFFDQVERASGSSAAHHLYSTVSFVSAMAKRKIVSLYKRSFLQRIQFTFTTITSIITHKSLAPSLKPLQTCSHSSSPPPLSQPSLPPPPPPPTSLPAPAQPSSPAPTKKSSKFGPQNSSRRTRTFTPTPTPAPAITSTPSSTSPASQPAPTGAS